LYDDRGALGAIELGPADAIALASDLLLAARLRYGRACLEKQSAEIPSEAA
jgi:hypothetical protein